MTTKIKHKQGTKLEYNMTYRAGKERFMEIMNRACPERPNFDALLWEVRLKKNENGIYVSYIGIGDKTERNLIPRVNGALSFYATVNPDAKANKRWTIHHENIVAAIYLLKFCGADFDVPREIFEKLLGPGVYDSTVTAKRELELWSHLCDTYQDMVDSAREGLNHIARRRDVTIERHGLCDGAVNSGSPGLHRLLAGGNKMQLL